MEVRQYLHQKGFEWAEKNRSGGLNAVMNCPFCEDKSKKFAINLETGAFNCMHLNSCGVQGSFWDFQKMLGDQPQHLNNQTDFIKISTRTYQIPKPQVKKVDSEITKYLKKRGFTEETIKFFKIGQKDNAIAIPYFKDGKVTNVKYRTIDKKMWSEKNAEPTLYNRDNVTHQSEIVITEGEFDAIALYQYGIMATSIPNGVKDFRWLDNEWEWLKRFKTIFLCFDNDLAGRGGMMELVNKLGAWRCKNVTLPLKDANECLKNGIKEDDIVDCFALAGDFVPSKLVSTAAFEEDIVDLFENPDKLNGVPTAWKKLDYCLKGWRLEELTIWSGRNGSGKSTILNQHILDIAKKGIKSCIASLEMPPARYLRWAVIQQTKNSKPYKKEIKQSLAWMNEKIYIVDTHEEIKSEDLLNIFEYAARRYNVKHFVIDSLMRVGFNSNEELKEQKAFVSSLLSFVKKFKCHVHLVAHPRKGMKDTDKPDKVDIMGSGDITNLAHNVLIMWRPNEEKKQAARAEKKFAPDAILYVKKNREFGIEGGIGLSFNIETKNYTEAKN